MTIGKLIREYREKQNMSQQSLAKRLNVTRESVSNWEHDKREPKIKILLNIISILGVTREQFFQKL
jgi:transcriptional regulator with XRE-family HTH domain